MFDLKGKVAVVTGASRGVGRGIAIGLGEAGATVYVTGRTTRDGDGDGPGTIYRTADEVTFIGGKGIPVRCDHRLDREVEALFDQVGAEQGRLDILVNNVWGGYQSMMEGEEFTWMNPFWKQPMWRWDAIFEAGVRGHFTASRQAAPMMIKQGSGLIVNVSYWAGRKYMSNVPYGVAKAATDKMAADMAYELRHYGVAAVSLYPGVVRTEKVMASGAFFDLSNSESPQFAGRAVAALATDPNVMEKSGQVLMTAALGLEYGFTDVDGKQPRPLTLEEVWG